MLNLYINMGKTDILTSLSFSIYEHDMSFSFLWAVSYSFQPINLHIFCEIYPCIFYTYAITNGIVFFSFNYWLFLLYRNKINFSMSILYPKALPYSLINFSSFFFFFFVDSIGPFLHKQCHLSIIAIWRASFCFLSLLHLLESSI